MGYYNKTKVIASTSGRPIIGPVIMVTDTEPTTRTNGDALVLGDAWWSPATTTLSNWLPDDQSVSSWVAVDGSADFGEYFTKEETESKIRDYLLLVGFTEDPDHETGYILNNNIVGEVRARGEGEPNQDVVISNGNDIVTSKSLAQSYGDVYAGFPWDTNASDANGVPTGPKVLFRGLLDADGNISSEAVFYGDVKEGNHGAAGRSKFSGDYLREMLGIVSAGNDEDAEAQGINQGDMYYNSTFGKYIARS